MNEQSGNLDHLQIRLRSHLDYIAQERDIYLHRITHLAVREYVREQLAALGEVTSHYVEMWGDRFENLVLDLPGQPSSGLGSRSPILIGAHYDGVLGSPGADDNASGVAVLIELGRAIAAQPAPYPVRLVAFDLEEYGLLGSRAYAAHLREQGESLRLMLSLEMLGYADPTPGSQHYPFGLKFWYPDQGDYIALVGNIFTISEMRRLSHGFHQVGVGCEWLAAGIRGFVVPATRRSDHSPFWDLGYKAMMVTDTAFLRNPHYHRASDCVETLDLSFLTQVCVGLNQGIRRL